MSFPAMSEWDAYAPFYDWENAQTLGRRDLAFWRRLAEQAGGRVLELGTGTGRVALPLIRAGVPLVGVDRSAGMLDRAAKRVRRLRARRDPGDAKRSRRPASRPGVPFAIADVGHLPFRAGSCRLVVAPYGLVQSILSDRALARTLRGVAHVLAPGGRFVVDLVPDLARWPAYTNRVTMKGRLGRHGEPVRLVESVEQDPARGITRFDQTFVVGRGRAGRGHRFSLTFRSLDVPAICRRLVNAGFRVEAVLGDYDGRGWDERADVWVVVAALDET